MAFRKKAEFILTYKPDILIVPECEHPDKFKFKNGASIPTDVFWFGSNPNKGLGVFSYSDFKFQLNANHNSELKTILPLSVSNTGEVGGGVRSSQLSVSLASRRLSIVSIANHCFPLSHLTQSLVNHP